jgi:hypothetical protein
MAPDEGVGSKNEKDEEGQPHHQQFKDVKEGIDALAQSQQDRLVFFETGSVHVIHLSYLFSFYPFQICLPNKNRQNLTPQQSRIARQDVRVRLSNYTGIGN